MFTTVVRVPCPCGFSATPAKNLGAPASAPPGRPPGGPASSLGTTTMAMTMMTATPAAADPEVGRDLGVAQAEEVAQDQHLPLTAGQPRDRLEHLTPFLAGQRRRFGRPHRRVIRHGPAQLGPPACPQYRAAAV